MNNFKDYLNFSSNLSDNLYRLQLIALTEAKKKKEKKEKKANKDYDGDGKVESGSDEYLGSRKKAIEKAIQGKKVLESVETEMGGNEGGGVVHAFNDSNDGPNTKDEQIATLPDLHSALAKAVMSHDEGIYQFGRGWAGTMAGQKSRDAITAIEDAIRAHPESQAKMAAAKAARAAEGPGFFSQKGEEPDPFDRIDTPAERGLNMGGERLPPTDYDLGKSGRKER